MKVITALIASLAVGLAKTAYAEDLQQRLSKMPPATQASDKSSLELEYCIGVGLADLALPMSIRGERKVLIFAGAEGWAIDSVAYLVAINDEGTRRTVGIQSNKSWDDRIRALVASCL